MDENEFFIICQIFKSLFGLKKWTRLKIFYWNCRGKFLQLQIRNFRILTKKFRVVPYFLLFLVLKKFVGWICQVLIKKLLIGDFGERENRRKKKCKFYRSLCWVRRKTFPIKTLYRRRNFFVQKTTELLRSSLSNRFTGITVLCARRIICAIRGEEKQQDMLLTASGKLFFSLGKSFKITRASRCESVQSMHDFPCHSDSSLERKISRGFDYFPLSRRPDRIIFSLFFPLLVPHLRGKKEGGGGRAYTVCLSCTLWCTRRQKSYTYISKKFE